MTNEQKKRSLGQFDDTYKKVKLNGKYKVFEDPITKKNLEGEAVVIEICSEYDPQFYEGRLQTCIVKFKNVNGGKMRMVDARDLLHDHPDETEANEYTLCLKCQMGFLPSKLNDAGLCVTCGDDRVDKGIVIADLVEILEAVEKRDYLTLKKLVRQKIWDYRK